LIFEMLLIFKHQRGFIVCIDHHRQVRSSCSTTLSSLDTRGLDGYPRVRNAPCSICPPSQPSQPPRPSCRLTAAGRRSGDGRGRHGSSSRVTCAACSSLILCRFCRGHQRLSVCLLTDCPCPKTFTRTALL